MVKQGFIKRIYNKTKYVKRIYRNLRYLMTHDLEDHDLQQLDLFLETNAYEYEDLKKSLPNFKILDEDESIQKLMDEPKSLCRMGDGEIDLMKGKNQPFQDYDPKLAETLEEILEKEHSDMYVAINRAYFHAPLLFCKRNKDYYRIYGRELRNHFIGVCNPNTEYLDAGFLCAYYRYSDEYDFDNHFKKMENMFKGKNIALLGGVGTLNKITFDVFCLANKKTVIPCPSVNAYAKYDEILNEVTSTISKDYLVCIALGMTAKALVYDLTKLGYMAWDIGHLLKDYDEYRKKMPRNEENKAAFWDVDK